MKSHETMFGEHFKYVLVLTALAWMTYTLPPVRAAFVDAAVAYDPSTNTAASVNLQAKVVSANNSTPSCYVFSSDLSMGSTGNDVSSLQAWLVAHGYNIPALSSNSQTQGYFGGQTLSAVVQYQRDNGIMPSNEKNGYFGPLTRAKVNASCVQPVVTGSLNIDSASPLQSTVLVTDSTTGSLPGLPVLVFDLRVQAAPGALVKLAVHISSPVGGSAGTIGNAYLYQGSTLLATAVVQNGVAQFGINGAGAPLPADVNVPFTVKTDISGVTSGSGFTVSASINGNTDVSAWSISNLSTPVNVSGSAAGATITVVPASLVAATGYVTVGAPIVSGIQKIFNVTYKVIISAGNAPIFVAANGSMTSSVGTPNLGANYVNVSADPGQLPGDGASYYMIPANTSRTFYLYAVLSNTTGMGAGSFTITQINYGTTPSSLYANAITQGLSGLKANVIF